MFDKPTVFVFLPMPSREKSRKTRLFPFISCQNCMKIHKFCVCFVSIRSISYSPKAALATLSVSTSPP